MFFPEIKKYAYENYIPVIRDGSAQVLFDTVKEKQPARILEIGTAVGYSGLIMLTAHAGAVLDTVEIKRDRIEKAVANFEKYGVPDRARVLEGDAGEVLFRLCGKYDFIFLDGPKTKYPVYYETLLGHLETGGILFADNVLLDGKVRGETATKKGKETITEGIRKFLKLVTTDVRLETKLLETGDGITISRKL